MTSSSIGDADDVSDAARAGASRKRSCGSVASGCSGNLKRKLRGKLRTGNRMTSSAFVTSALRAASVQEALVSSLTVAALAVPGAFGHFENCENKNLNLECADNFTHVGNNDKIPHLVHKKVRKFTHLRRLTLDQWMPWLRKHLLRMLVTF